MRTKLTLLVGLLTLAVAIILASGSGPGSSGETKEVYPVATTGTDRDLEVCLDDTSSTSAEVRQLATQLLADRIGELVRSGRYTRCRVRHFGANGWMNSEIHVPIPIANAAPCDPASVAGQMRVFKPAVDRAKQLREDECKRLASKDAEAYERQLSAALASIVDALEAVKEGSSSCTAFYDLLASVALTAKPDSSVIIVSDAMETCARNPATIPVPPPTSHVELMLLPSRYDVGSGRSAFAQYELRKDNLDRIAPWLEVEPPGSHDIGQRNK